MATSEKQIVLGNQTFVIDTSIYANARRELYFQQYPHAAADVKLTKEEERLLAALGIDAPMITSMRMYMATFFEQLPTCQTDSSLMLSRACEVPHYVVWSTQFAKLNKLSAQVDAEYARHPPRADIEIAIDDAILHSIRPKTRELGTYDQLFQLVRVAPATHIEPVTDYDRLFALQVI